MVRVLKPTTVLKRGLCTVMTIQPPQAMRACALEPKHMLHCLRDLGDEVLLEPLLLRLLINDDGVVLT